MDMDVEIKHQGISVLSYFHEGSRIPSVKAYHLGIETECKSVEAKEALNSHLGRICSLLTTSLIKNLMPRRCHKQYTHRVQVLP